MTYMHIPKEVHSFERVLSGPAWSKIKWFFLASSTFALLPSYLASKVLRLPTLSRGFPTLPIQWDSEFLLMKGMLPKECHIVSFITEDWSLLVNIAFLFSSCPMLYKPVCTLRITWEAFRNVNPFLSLLIFIQRKKGSEGQGVLWRCGGERQPGSWGIKRRRCRGDR